jgi:hypothetical protein
VSIAISGLPAGATLSAGTFNSDGSYTLTPGQLPGLVLNAAETSGTLPAQLLVIQHHAFSP